jgi:hypothetical protein
MAKRAVIPVAAFIAGVSALTVAQLAGLVSQSDLASSPHQISEGKIWLLITNGLVVQRPIVLSLASFAALAFVALVVCGPQVLWYSAVLGHICSTLALYTLLDGVRLVQPHAFGPLIGGPDYGVSAISAAWLGAIAATAWRRRGNSFEARAQIVLSCAAIAAFAWMVKRHLNILDTDHAIAFGIGIAMTTERARMTFDALAVYARHGGRGRVPGTARAA